jgi:hypothetical protein
VDFAIEAIEGQTLSYILLVNPFFSIAYMDYCILFLSEKTSKIHYYSLHSSRKAASLKTLQTFRLIISIGNLNAEIRYRKTYFLDGVNRLRTLRPNFSDTYF